MQVRFESLTTNSISITETSATAESTHGNIEGIFYGVYTEVIMNMAGQFDNISLLTRGRECATPSDRWTEMKLGWQWSKEGQRKVVVKLRLLSIY